MNSTTLGVAEAARRVTEAAEHVYIDDEQIAQFCASVPDGKLPVPPWDDTLHYGDGTWRTANYVLVLDALNFCFWPDPDDAPWQVEYKGQRWGGYMALTAALRRAIEEGVPVTEAAWLAAVTQADVERLLAGRQGRIPMLEQRVAHLQEVGRVLTERWDGRFSNLVEAVEHDAVALASRVAEEFSSFNDVAEWRGQRVPLFKRAQILAVDLFGSLAGQQWGNLRRLDELTAFADYKVPQVLRRLKILHYMPELADIVDRQMLIPAGDRREVEIRCATVEAVERIKTRLKARSFEIDWYLWNVGQTPSLDDRPYHRTRTIYY
jgi:hypothetical protein